MTLWYVTDSDDYYQYGAWLVDAESAIQAEQQVYTQVFHDGPSTGGTIHATPVTLPEPGKLEWLTDQ